MNPSRFQTLIFLDLETTGLIIDRPKITELAMVAVHVETLLTMKSHEEIPRALNKFVKMFDPFKSISDVAVEMTGLTNQMLMNYSPFNRQTVQAIETFIQDFQGPICLIAHNGDQFDFPILLSEIESSISVPSIDLNSTSPVGATCVDDDQRNFSCKNDENLKFNRSQSDVLSNKNLQLDEDPTGKMLSSLNCADSLTFFRQLSSVTGMRRKGEPVVYVPSPDPLRQMLSMKLSKIYEREFSHPPTHFNSHRAEDDCLMLLAIVKRHLTDWLEWIDENHRPLKHFPSSLTRPLSQ